MKIVYFLYDCVKKVQYVFIIVNIFYIVDSLNKLYYEVIVGNDIILMEVCWK